MTITLFKKSPNVIDILNIKVGRFDGSLFRKHKSFGTTYWDYFYAVGIAAYTKT